MSLERAKALFVELVANVPQDQWGARLAELAAGDEELRLQVNKILAAHRDAGSFLDSPAPALGATINEPIAERPGTAIGPYKLLEQIGEGGMGTVWVAQQTEPVKRVVALKLIKAGMDSKQVIARFEAERQALALMDHPNITRVLDAGTTSTGQPYFVMDFVKGVPITKYCDEHHLTPRQRLELFIPVCQAVQHAHQKGIIHRDLKPSNVLVALYDGKPVPKVIDFGVAKAAGQSLTDKTLVTGFGNIVGTLEYMSPEQAEVNQLDIDTRSDIYSLGVLLYELLTGGPPFTRKDLEKAGMLEMLRVIREQEPSKPSTKLSTAEGLPTLAANRGTEPAKLTKLVRGELDWIVMKALEKDRNRRYETANGFAMDVQRYLADEPVQACPPSLAYRVRKFARRNRGPVLAALAIFLLLATGVVGTTWGWVHALAEADAKERQRERAENNAAAAKRQEIEALKQKRKAEEQASKANASLRLLQEMLASAHANSGKGNEYTVRQLLDDFSASLPQRLKGQPELEGAVRATIGDAYRSLGMTKKAKGHLQSALQLLRQSAGEESDDPRVLLSLAWISNSEGDHADAVALADEALRIHRSRQSKPGPILQAMRALQQFLLMQNKPIDSLQVGEEALAIARAAGQSERRSIPNILHMLADAKLHQGELAEAEKLARESIDLHRQMNGAGHPQTGWALFVLGKTLAKQDRSDEALPCFQEAQRIIDKNYTPNGRESTLVGKHLKALETTRSKEKQKSGQ